MTSFWAALDKSKRIMIAGAGLFAFLGIIFVSQMNGSGPMGLLYSGLDERSAGEVITALDTRSVPYEVKGTAIFVPESQRDQLRMSLAGDGLPTIGEQGYELLDNLSGFGTTSQMFNAAYWRAKEGELARTILEAPHIKSARVHISTAPDRPFQRGIRPTAAVTVQSASGNLSVDQARALRFLIAAAVSGMTPQDVSVIDEVGGLILSGEDTAASSGEDPRSTALKAKIENLLNARVGLNNSVVEITLETVSQSERITERLIDPAQRIVISEETQEITGSSENGLGGAVTVASNLPEGEGGGDSGSQSAKNAETRQRTNYEVSQTQREISRGPGDIRRMSVAVLVNHESIPQQDGTVLKQARDPEELEKLRNLVASAVGFNEARGDVLTIETMAFEPSSELGSYAGPGTSILDKLNPIALLQYLVGAAVIMVMGLFVIKPILLAAATTSNANAITDGTAATGTELIVPEGLDDEIDMNLSFGTADVSDQASAMGGDNLPDLGIGDFGGFETVGGFGDMGGMTSDDPAERLKSLISDRQDETLQVLQSWLDQDGQPSEGASS